MAESGLSHHASCICGKMTCDDGFEDLTEEIGPNMAKIAPKKSMDLGSTASMGASLPSLKFEDKARTVEEQGSSGDYSSTNRELRFMKKVKRRECCTFIEKPGQDAALSEDECLCQCDYPFSSHSHEAQTRRTSGVKWSPKEHTKAFPTNAFGEIEFVGYGDKVGKYVRVDVDTPMKTMLDLLQEAWGMEKPNLLISVTGGAKNFTMKPRLREVFRKGLMKAALSTGAWIVTGGTAAGVMKHVGEAVRDFGLTSEGRVMTIGIAPWGCVQNKECLIHSEGKWPALYRIEREVKRRQTFLDPNHTHFILVDNGTQQQFTVEIPFRAKLEEAIGKFKTNTGVDAVSVPVCLLVLEGGPGTLQTVQSALMSGTPTVVIKGSGKTADILAYAYQNAREEEVTAQDQEGKEVKKTNTVLDAHVLSEIEGMVKSHFGEDNLATRISWVKDCCRNLDLISVFELDSRNSARDVDLAILKALLKANKHQAMDQLKLALAWNRIDVAKSEIFTDERRWPTGMLDEVMMSAIQLNRVDFVELFLDNGVSLKDFLTIKRLVSLYNEIPQNTLLYTLLQRTKSKSRNLVSLSDVGNLIQFLLGDFYQPHYLTDSRLRDIDTDALFGQATSRPNPRGGLTMAQQVSSIAAPMAYADPSQASDNIDFSRPAQELFIWAVLMNHLKLSKVFWREGKEATAAALFARSILLAMKSFGVSSEIKRGFQSSADEYGSLAVGVINTCYSMDHRKTLDLLVRDMPHWGCSTCVLLAAHSDNRDFISQTAVKVLLNHIWKGNLDIETRGWRSTLCTIAFPLIPCLITFNEEEATGKATEGNNSDDVNRTSDKPRPMERQNTNLKPASMFRQPTAQNIEHSVSTAQPKKSYSVCQKIVMFYRSPVAKFNLHTLSYVAFLMLYAVVLVVKLERDFNMEEGFLIAYVGAFFIEEIRQFAFSYAKSFKSKLKAYLHDKLNILDIFSVFLFALGMAFRFVDSEDFLWAARVILSINFIGFLFRILHIFYRFEKLGPLVVMISEMVKDMLWFVVILAVFIVSYAIASEAVLYPNSQLNWKLLFYAPRKAYWAIYSEFLLDEIEGGASCTNDPSKYNNYSELRCPSTVGVYFVPILMGWYVLMTNVLLLNLLIAMFSNTFQRIRDEAEKHWSFLLFNVVFEYTQCPVFPPPFIIFSHIYMALSHCCRKCGWKQKRKIDFRKKFSDKLEEKQLIQWENVIADNFLTNSERKEANTVAGRVKSSTDRLETILSKVDELQESQHQGGGTGLLPALTDSGAAQMPEQVQKKLDNLEAQMINTTKALAWIMRSLEENKLNSKERKPYLPDLERQKQEEEQKKRLKKEKEKQLVKDLMAKEISSHYKSRISPYHCTTVARFPVPDEKVLWQIEYPEYNPPIFTTVDILKGPYYADIDLMALSVEARKTAITFNCYDKKSKVSRVSHVKTYDVDDGLPINPVGRTGLKGRGDLGRWGPNHAGDPVVTRWKYEPNGSCTIIDNKPVMEFVAVQRMDNGTWAIPGGICHPEEEPWHTLKTDFKEEAFGDQLEDEEKRAEIQSKLNALEKQGVEVYKGYADDPRNTDNAWLETRVMNYHDESGTILKHYNLRAGSDVEAVTWQTVSSTLALHGSHSYFLKLVADKHGAHF